MPGLAAALAGALLMGALNTLGDFVWARFIPAHRAAFGLAHGALLLMGLGLYLGLLRRRAAQGALGGALVGVLAAALFYGLARPLGYPAMFPSWMALWVGFAFLDARLRGGVPSGEILTRGTLAAVGSGAAFYAVSGIWTDPAPGGPRFAYNLLCWTLAFLPGLGALLLSRASAAPASR